MSEELNQQPVEAIVDAEAEVVQDSELDEQASAENVNDGSFDNADEDFQEEAEYEPEIAFSWEASEYVHNHKSMMWYGVLGATVVVLAGLAVLLHLWLEIGVFVTMGGALAVYAHKPPRTMKYELSDQGVHIDGKMHLYEEFRSFGVIPDEEWHSIDLEPAKKLNIRRVILFDTEDFDEIVDHLELHLPREDRPLDIIERITRYVRF